METVRVDEQGQIALPADVMKSLGIEKGSEVTFYKTDAGYVLRKEEELPYKVWRESYDAELLEAMKEMEEMEKNPHLYDSFTLEDIRNGNYRK